MDKLKLTKEQIDLIGSIVTQDWLNNFVQPEESSIEAIRVGIDYIYGLFGLKKPITIVVDSPFAGHLALNFLLNTFNTFECSVRQRVSNQTSNRVAVEGSNEILELTTDIIFYSYRIWEQVWEQADEQFKKQIWEQAVAQVEQPFLEQASDPAWKKFLAQVAQIKKHFLKLSDEEIYEDICKINEETFPREAGLEYWQPWEENDEPDWEQSDEQFWEQSDELSLEPSDQGLHGEGDEFFLEQSTQWTFDENGQIVLLEQSNEQLLEWCERSFWCRFEEQFWEQFFLEVRGYFIERVVDECGVYAHDQVLRPIHRQVNEEEWLGFIQAGEEVKKQVLAQVRKQMEEQIIIEFHKPVEKQALEQAWRQKKAQEKRSPHSTFSYLEMDTYKSIILYEFFARLGAINREELNKLTNVVKAVGTGIYGFIHLKGLCIVSTLPKLLRDERKRPHSLDQAAVKWADGYGLHFINGVYFPKELWTALTSKTITAQEVLRIANTEQKAIAIKLFGYAELLKESKSTVISRETVNINGQLKVYEVIETDLGDDRLPARFVKVVCWSTLKETLLRVDPRNEQTLDPIGAIAWTAGLTKEEYLMAIET